MLYRLYTATIIVLGGASVWLACIEASLLIQKPPFWILGILLALGLVLSNMTSRLPGVGHRYATSFFAPILILGPMFATLVCAVAGILSLLFWEIERMVARMRHEVQMEERRPIQERLLGTLLALIAVTCAGLAFTAIGGRAAMLDSAPRLVPDQIIPIVATAVILFFFEVLLQETETALRLDRPLLATWRNGFLYSAPVAAALAGLGLLLALLYQFRRPGFEAMMLIAVIPCWLLYYSFRLYLEMRRAYDRTLRTLAGLVESRICSPAQIAQQTMVEAASGEKLRLVERWAVAVARQMGLSPKEVEQIRYASYLLEVGKIGIPRALLTRSNFVSVRQRKAYANHVVLANQILEPVEFLRPVGTLILYHQERYDGLGGPSGLRGDAIPLGSRILAAAHALVELTTGEETGYRMELADALKRIQASRGIRFDPKIVDVLTQVAQRQDVHTLVEQQSLAATVPVASTL